MKKPLIGVLGVARDIKLKSHQEQINPSFAITERIRQAVIETGGNPLMILPAQNVSYLTEVSSNIPKMTEIEKNMIIEQLSVCNGLLIPGGVRWYEHDLFACRYALDHNMPLLGICRGMQIMAATDNIKCNNYPETIKKNSTNINHYQPKSKEVHNIRIFEGTKLLSIIGKKSVIVNSSHNFSVAKTYESFITSYSPDNLAESLEFPKCEFAIGVQWHPELSLNEEANVKLLKRFIEVSGNNHLI